MKNKKGMPGPATPFKMQGKSPMMKQIQSNQKGLQKLASTEKGKKAVKAMGYTEDVDGAMLMNKDYATMMGGYKSPLNYGSPIKKGPGDEEAKQIDLENITMTPTTRTFGSGGSGGAVFEGSDGKVKGKGAKVAFPDGRTGIVTSVSNVGPQGQKTSQTRQTVKFYKQVKAKK